MRQAVYDIVVIAFVGDEDVHPQFRVGRCVEGTHGDANPVRPVRIEKERRAARRAEASPHVLRAEPRDLLVTLNLHG